MLLLEFDLAGAEWVVVAYASGEQRMINVVESGASAHVETAHLITRAPHELIIREDKILDKMTDPDEIALTRRNQVPALFDGDYFLPRNMTCRQAGKKSNHGLNYGMRYKRFALENGMDERDAKRIVMLYTDIAYPGIKLWWASIKDQLKKDRTLTNCLGRKVRLLDEWGDDLFRAAYSFIPQSTIVDICLQAMCDAEEDTSRIFWMADLNAQTHDSITYQYPLDFESMATFCIRLGHGYMRPRLSYEGRDFQVGVDLKVGTHWGKEMISCELVDDASQVERNLRECWEKLNSVSTEPAL